MVLIKANISEDLEQNFRKAAMQLYKYRKGAISEAVESALFEWTASRKEIVEETQNSDNPFSSLRGILKDVKMTSLELQKETNKWRGERYDRHRR